MVAVEKLFSKQFSNFSFWEEIFTLELLLYTLSSKKKVDFFHAFWLNNFWIHFEY